MNVKVFLKGGLRTQSALDRIRDVVLAARSKNWVQVCVVCRTESVVEEKEND